MEATVCGKGKEVCEEWSQCCDRGCGNADSGLYHGPFYKIDAVPGVVCCVFELVNVDDSDYSCATCTLHIQISMGVGI